jgi:pyrophosphatase PpaX
VRTVLFDLDGTVIDSVEMIVRGLTDSIAYFGGTPSEPAHLTTIIGMPLVKQMEIHGVFCRDAEHLNEITEHVVQRYAHYSYLQSPFEPCVKAIQLCQSEGIQTCVVTSRNRTEWAALHKQFEFLTLFNHVVCAGDTEHPKPSAEPALHALKISSTPPEHAVMVGDSIFDIQCAQNAGIRCAAAMFGSGSRADLLELRPDIVLEQPTDLLDWVRQLSLTNQNAKEENQHRRTTFIATSS